MNGKEALSRQAVAWATLLAFGLTLAPFPNAEGAAQQPAESKLAINHEELACVNTDYAPKVDAQVAPGREFERGYVYFKAAGTEDYYYAVMKGAPENLEGVLPRPLPETKAIDYRLKATDVQALSKQTREYTPPVVPGSACKVKGVPVGSKGANLTIGLTREGQKPIPPGFNKKDIAFVILLSGAVVTVAQALAGAGGATATTGGGTTGGGGLSGTTLAVAGGVAVAAGAGIAISNRGGTSSTNTPLPSSTPQPTSTPTPTPTSTPTATSIPFRFIEADATWSGPGDVDVQILNPSNQPVGMTFPAGCESTSQRTERVTLTGAVPTGTYRVMLTGKSCGAGTPPSIAVAFSVQSDSGPKCPNAFVNVPVGSTIQGCTFAVP